MRPRYGSGGNLPLILSVLVALLGFNEAAIWKSRKCRKAPPHRDRSTSSFNEAAIWKSRKFVGCRKLRLQATVASMRPRYGSRGNLAICLAIHSAMCFGFNEAAIWKSRKCPASGSTSAISECFNEAAIWKSRKSTGPSGGGLPGLASMRPRYGSRGNYSRLDRRFSG